MTDFTTNTITDENGFLCKELTSIQREYVKKMYKREKGEHGTSDPRYKSVMFGKYQFQNGDDPFLMQRDWPVSERKPVLLNPNNKTGLVTKPK